MGKNKAIDSVGSHLVGAILEGAKLPFLSPENPTSSAAGSGGEGG